LNVKHTPPVRPSALAHLQRSAIAVAAALETAQTSTPAGGLSMTFTFAGEAHLQAASDAWRAYAYSTIDAPVPLAATASQMLTAQIGQALFNDPTLDLMQIANRVEAARRALGVPLLMSAGTS